jgi:hypothetical protein
MPTARIIASSWTERALGGGIGNRPMASSPFDFLDRGEGQWRPIISFAEELDESLARVGDHGRQRCRRRCEASNSAEIRQTIS